MTLTETREKILNDDEFVLSESKKLNYLYGLKKEIRWNQNRNNISATESVAEHIYGMHVIAKYFLSIEEKAADLDLLKVSNMITWHDMEEIETGDIVSHHKTEADKKAAEKAIPVVLSKMPENMQSDVKSIIYEYEDQQTAEAKFVKAIDKVETLFEVWSEDYKKILHKNANTVESHLRTKKQYVEEFPYIMRFFELNTKRLQDGEFFEPSA